MNFYIKIFTLILTIISFTSNIALSESCLIPRCAAAECSCETASFTVSNKLFSIELPDKFKKTISVKKIKDGIYFYDKDSKKAGFGGFAFGIQPYKNPSDYAEMPGGRKIGELEDKKGVIYDMVLVQPTDVQYDYVTGKTDLYMPLYNMADTVSKKIKGIKGSTYYNERGTKGEEMYQDILQKHINAVKEKWDSIKLEKENMSYMYNVMASYNKNVLDKVGYVFYDINGDGIEELLVGEIAEGEWKGIIYDIYTMVNRKPVHVVSGGSRNRFFICNFICNEQSGGANESIMQTYVLIGNSTELYPQVGFKYEGYDGNHWFLNYGTGDDWEEVSEETYIERKKTFENYKRFNYIPLSRLK